MTLLTEDISAHLQEWPARTVEAEEQMLIKANIKSHDAVIYTDGSLIRGRCEWGRGLRESEGGGGGGLPTSRTVVVGWLLNVPAARRCISGTGLLRQIYLLPH